MQQCLIAYSAALLALAITGAGAILLTEIGQLLNLPRDWVFGYFHIRGEASLFAAAALAVLIFCQFRYSVLARWQYVTCVAVTLLCLFLVNWFVPYYWLRSEQHDARFISIAEADALLADTDDVLALEINGDARAYPREWMQLPHFAGHRVGGEEVVMSYCALSDLPAAFSTTFNGAQADYRVIAQVHNNLIFTDTNSGELFQQITGRGEFSGASPESFPVQRMPWGSFKQIYPQGLVFFTEPTLFDKGTQLIFEAGLASHYGGKPLFPTLRMDDDRLPPGEVVWGITIEDDSVAVARAAFDQSLMHHITLGDRALVVKWNPELETMGAFFAEANGETVNMATIDPYGNSDVGKLERVNTYPGIRWMVWSHWFPDTRLIN